MELFCLFGLTHSAVLTSAGVSKVNVLYVVYRLVTGGMQGMFDFVFIDECGQASEPEALIAIAGIITTKKCPSVGQLVLAGDPQQLGPVLSSQLVKNFGLGQFISVTFQRSFINEAYI